MYCKWWWWRTCVLISLAAVILVPAPRIDAARQCMGTLVIPAIELRTCIVEAPLADGWHQVPDAVVGRAAGTGWINVLRYNTVLIGHTPGVLSGVSRLERGDMLWIFDVATSAQFEVIDVYVTDPGNTAPFNQTDEPVVTLITCTDNDMRRIVRAQRVG